jgi:hypothetical protein
MIKARPRSKVRTAAQNKVGLSLIRLRSPLFLLDCKDKPIRAKMKHAQRASCLRTSKIPAVTVLKGGSLRGWLTTHERLTGYCAARYLGGVWTNRSISGSCRGILGRLACSQNVWLLQEKPCNLSGIWQRTNDWGSFELLFLYMMPDWEYILSTPWQMQTGVMSTRSSFSCLDCADEVAPRTYSLCPSVWSCTLIWPT